ncbi:MAG: TipAS antibiotic-recognition domain-containing protein [Actinomycetota bacterium]|nr:TipAS antibiotic-recognition domain-containing protein [Actinomycetota bacterium]
MTAQDIRAWKIGQLAAETGLTVRALHHYDHLGLVQPSARTDSGYRLYAESDVERLYRVLALRQLGLPLDAIGRVLDGQTSIEELLDAHREYLDRQLVALRTLRAQVAIVAAAGRTGEAASVTHFLELIRKVITVDDTIKQYFSEEQLAQLAERRATLGEPAIAEVQAAWPRLIAAVQAAVDAGVDPASAQAQELAAEWMGLLQQFHGGDEGLRGSLYRMYAENAEQIEAQHGGPSPAVMDFIKAANAARN